MAVTGEVRRRNEERSRHTCPQRRRGSPSASACVQKEPNAVLMYRRHHEIETFIAVQIGERVRVRRRTRRHCRLRCRTKCTSTIAEEDCNRGTVLMSGCDVAFAIAVQIPQRESVVVSTRSGKRGDGATGKRILAVQQHHDFVAVMSSDKEIVSVVTICICNCKEMRRRKRRYAGRPTECTATVAIDDRYVIRASIRGGDVSGSVAIEVGGDNECRSCPGRHHRHVSKLRSTFCRSCAEKNRQRSNS